jgi:hypothetical protein
MRGKLMDKEKEYFVIYGNYPLAESFNKHIEYVNDSVEQSSTIHKILKQLGTLQDPIDKRKAKSIEIQQKVFIDILKGISAGLPLDEIENFPVVFLNAQCIKKIDQFTIDSMEKQSIINRSSFEYRDSRVDGTESDFLYCLACYSLLSFLALNKREKIKCCPYCKKFFIAKNTRRKICYKKSCWNEYHKADMKERREIDPEKYMR